MPLFYSLHFFAFTFRIHRFASPHAIWILSLSFPLCYAVESNVHLMLSFWTLVKLLIYVIVNNLALHPDQFRWLYFIFDFSSTAILVWSIVLQFLILAFLDSNLFCSDFIYFLHRIYNLFRKAVLRKFDEEAFWNLLAETHCSVKVCFWNHQPRVAYFF